MTGSHRRDEYWARINRAMDYVEEHLGEPLTVADVAAAAWFSPFHFHRIFTSLVGETLGEYIQRVRLDRAARQLLAYPRMSVTRIAMVNGYSSPAAFSRAFRAAHGVSPSAWRRAHAHDAPPGEKSKIGKGDRKIGQEGGDSAAYVAGEQDDPRTLRRRREMEPSVDFDVTVQDEPAFHVAYVRHIGPYQGDGELFKALFGRLMAWAGPRGLVCPPETRFLTIYHDDPNITEASKLRTSVCISVPEDTQVSGEVGKMAVPAGRYARLRFELLPTDYQAAWETVYGSWLPDSGYQPVDAPPYEQYLNDASKHPEGKAIVEICLPVKPL